MASHCAILAEKITVSTVKIVNMSVFTIITQQRSLILAGIDRHSGIEGKNMGSSVFYYIRAHVIK